MESLSVQASPEAQCSERERERERDAFLNGVGTYPPGTVGQGCRLLNRCHNLPPGHCGAEEQTIMRCWGTVG